MGVISTHVWLIAFLITGPLLILQSVVEMVQAGGEVDKMTPRVKWQVSSQTFARLFQRLVFANLSSQVVRKRRRCKMKDNLGKEAVECNRREDDCSSMR